jgi:DNA-binding CsgD family transcriptional regulator
MTELPGRQAADAATGLDEPWLALPRDFAEKVCAERASLAAEIVREIRRQVPAYNRPLSGRFGAGIQRGVQTALQEFTDLVEGGGPILAERARVYRALGRGEFVEGRSLDMLQAAYRLGARVAWRRYARIARRIGLEPELMIVLAEAVFAHIDQIAAASVTGYAQAKADAASSIDRQRRRLLDLLLRGAAPAGGGVSAGGVSAGGLASAGGAAPAELARAATEARWPLPERLACAVVTRPDAGDSGSPRGRPARWPEEVLTDLDRPDPYVLLPDPAARLDDPEVRRALRSWSAVVGPTVPVAMAADSLRWARRLADRLAEGLPRDEPVLSDRHLADLLLLADEPLVRLFGERRLEPLADLTVKQRRRLESTLLAWLTTGRGTAAEVAARLGVHPQTARQRMRRVHVLFGDALAEPEVRFELEVALRGRTLSDGI